MLKKKRIKKQMTELELAKKIGRSEGHVSKLETHPEKCNPGVRLILKLAKELSLNPVKVFLFFVKHIKDQDK
ncbi:helix-turn-helix transcriptional regulator [Clostridium botulinum]|uniref:helix-turn-helix transcriptional regulator n=1 Tax=Clostridium botulinum TaxID=1491 RepID=UPI0013F0963F|nr:helix-turn-helix transcriptional regulator [Clostridium botulinum]MCS6110352.1 XRE family transcriptional regulator [Clostridium botulinum]NFE12314.1 helix-turn-helix transcriptional regulator [Clostridium botulinum]NFE84595.1 helix-turn-helix transcriptional regulator [Clostridium botulinum]NFH89708.1 helix-turn-helix transcriptional regulator [Clostridium botulinum]NFI17129.1 helix-turn-helix transcriptional regulator [Clostridium botulinum]